MSSHGSRARQVGLLAVVFLASLALLAGGTTLLGRGSTSSSASPVASTTGTASPPVSPSGSTRVAPSGASGDMTVVLTGAGDIADCSLAGSNQTADLLLAQTGTVFTAGDNAYGNGSAKDYSACYAPTWGRLLDRTILPAPGNHDWNTADAAGYRAYFGSTGAGPAGATWYSRDVGAWHVVVLDSSCAKVGGCDAASLQGRWLAADLAASNARCTLAIWHHPRFSSGEHGNDPSVAPFWDILEAAGADLIVNGHDHDYERFAPQSAAGEVLRPGGIRQIVVGTGGAELRPFHSIAANSEFRQAGTYGVLRLTLHPVNYDWEFLPVSGPVADAGSTPCH
ncbi:MAG TPA: metallophosphoesterase [Patescibacteria group bacterium]|nr:metallophosphoesterase [Patescibacteria group bacterium]